MFLFIFESIGTSELILIGVVALIFLGPRKLPEYAKKIGKMMNEFRSTTNEFKATWEREVNFDDEAKAFRIDDDAPAVPVARITSISSPVRSDISDNVLSSPSITEVDPAGLDADGRPDAIPAMPKSSTKRSASEDINDKKNWL